MTELPPDTPRIGVDEWVESVEGRRAAGPLVPVRRVFDRTPDAVRLLVFVGAVALVPVLTSDQYVLRVGVDTLIFALLAIGLNVVVGFAGLLDLGYVAFFGVGAYGYALLSSDHYGIHWPAELSVPLIVVATGVVGLLLGSSSWRLLGDYLAIVTLFFLQAFVVITTNGSNLSFLGLTGSTNLTGGPNGIPGLDPFEIFGLQIDSERGYFYLALVATALVLTMLYLAIRSRTGRAWQALREDPLAAELMGMPVNRLKLLAFAFGAAVAGLTGTIQASLAAGVFPDNYDVPLLITIYAMLILGGAGSLSGAVLGAIVVNVSLEVLRDANQARWLFLSVVFITLIAKVRPWSKLGAVLGGLVGFGYAFHAIVGAVWPSGTAGEPAGGDAIGRAIQSWVIHPSHSTTEIGNYAFVALVLAVLGLTLLRGLWRTVALVPTIYLAAFVWENRLIATPEAQAANRFLVLGALLVVLMAARPQGLLGTSRVEIA
jgi:ABC-type branched-subunit amino acid transport system permease subunit